MRISKAGIGVRAVGENLVGSALEDHAFSTIVRHSRSARVSRPRRTTIGAGLAEREPFRKGCRNPSAHPRKEWWLDGPAPLRYF